MNFLERVKNTVASFLFEHLFRNIVMVRNANLLLDKHFPGETRPDLLELEKNVSVAFSFGHPLILDGWAPMVPNYVQLGRKRFCLFSHIFWHVLWLKLAIISTY